MKYYLFYHLDKVEQDVRMKLVEEGFEGKAVPIPIKGLADNFMDGIKEFLFKKECLGPMKEVEVNFVRGYEGEVNFETDTCQYITLKGIQYYAWATGCLQETDEKICLTLEVFWDDSNGQ